MLKLLSRSRDLNENVVEKRQTDSGKNRGIWPLPGGTNSYVDTLFKYLQVVDGGTNTRGDLINWYINNFENVKSQKTAVGYINVPRNMGLTTSANGKIVLTNVGQELLESRNLDLLYETISDNMLAFDDIVEFIVTSKEVQSEQSILEYLKENFDIEWSTFAQVNFRLIWLMNLGKIQKTDEGYLPA